MSTIIELIQSSCQKHPNATALREKKNKRWQSITYADLWRESDKVAAGLNQLGIAQNSHIALLAPSSMCWITTYLGVLKQGCVVIPIDKELKQNELRHVLIDSEVNVVFTVESYVEDLLELRKNLTDLQHIVVMDNTLNQRGPASETFAIIGDLITEWHSLVNTLNIPREQAEKLEQLANKTHQLLTSASPAPSNSEAPDLFSPSANQMKDALKKGVLLNYDQLIKNSTIEPTPITADDTAVILYTSGTTGRSKGAILSHGNITSNVKDLIPHFQLDQRIHTLSFLPINHVFEQVCGILLPLTLGGTISFAESLKKLGENLAEVKPTFLLGVPAVYRIFLDRIMKGINSKKVSKALYSLPLTRTVVAKKVRETLGAGTIFVSGGAALDPAVAAQFKELDILIYQGYGITETSPVITAEQPGKMRLGTVGRPLPSVQVKIANPNDEGIGEILCKGPNVMKGYYKNTDATNEVLVDGWYHTGDMGKIDSDGYLSICGRVKNLIVTPNGKNVYPEEIENELLNSPFIQEVMIYGHKVSPTAEEVHAQIYPDQEVIDSYAQEQGLYPLEHKAVEGLIRDEVLKIGKQLADYKRVKRFTLREDEFPKTTTRKIKRFVVEADISATE
ncbi:AMP-binding protein [Desulfuromonas acetoxidans]|uniref:AMP-dependent synthetase and ligase n=1 Tax=Desulfuromonas acetoxidans (strain DSM 684 / 11070) TaxID=281689 RepID=Q1JVS5_DESA6|nr:AMP-binding protein [Desulfuromonas acetoxidans]EAT14329.1 AMP-dependent synthetase and ligase [Desulfuromonas acetoxidans DSM 684]MBF0646778.1 AMP-binding protein [Desulfuromonas acetoxidans]NVD24453.1 AMP-binding protein [Desulfuromonas acetoxidans]NVE16599.1 AMP-binding protein [Desulfuromonas acetoxidans]